MFNPTPWKGSLLSVSVLSLLLIAAGSASRIKKSSHSFNSNRLNSHNNSLLYTGDTDLVGTIDTPVRFPARYVRREKNNDLVIEIPDVANGKYKIRFLDEQNVFLFEIRQIRDTFLVVEKYNFLHAGMFRYELYKDNQMIDKSSFIINKE
jgi:hypothetical protein